MKMVLIVPDYYEDFACVGGTCSDTCCAGWEVDVDEETYAYYQEVPGAFGKRLRENMVQGEETGFVLKNGRCPFLNSENLCDIYLELGEEALCDICTMYPRYRMEYGDTREISLGAACVEVGKLIFARRDKITFIETTFDAAYQEYEWVGEAESGTEQEKKEREEETLLADEIQYVRKICIEILQNREKPVGKRIRQFIRFGAWAQTCLNQGLEGKSENWVSEFFNRERKQEEAEKPKTGEQAESALNLYQAFSERLSIFGKMEILDEEWESIYEDLQTVTEETYVRQRAEFEQMYEEHSYEYEHLLVYFVFQYLMKAWYDRNIFGKIQFIVMSFLMIRDMDVRRYAARKQFTTEDRIDILRIYSKEVEHSQDNLNDLAEEFLFSEYCGEKQLEDQI